MKDMRNNLKNYIQTDKFNCQSFQLAEETMPMCRGFVFHLIIQGLAQVRKK